MSPKQKTLQKISPYKEVANVLRNDFPQVVGSFIKNIDGKPHYCALGFLAKNKGVKDWELRLRTFLFEGNILSRYGFSESDLAKDRLCPVDGCNSVSTLFNMITHLNDKHKLPPRLIADYEEKMEFDSRKIPSTWQRVRDSVSNFFPKFVNPC